jgi:hypothetical protein
LWAATKDLGYWPVPVGTVPPIALQGCLTPDGKQFDDKTHPHLIDYFRHVGPVRDAVQVALARPPEEGVEPAKPLSKRQIEYGIFGRLASRFGRTRAVGMRSGGLDAIAFAGIPVISVDIAIAKSDPRKRDLKKAHGNTESWTRAAKREIILPGRFHQLFMDALRPVADLTKADWAGELTDTDVNRVKKALTTFFGQDDELGTKTKMFKSQPVPRNVTKASVEGLIKKLQEARTGGEVVIDAELAAALGIKDPA